MAKTSYSRVDEYGFERPANFNYDSYGEFISSYLGILTRRTKRWNEVTTANLCKSDSKLKRFVRKGVPISLRADIWMITSGAKNVQQKSTHKYVTLVDNIKDETIIEMIKIDLPRTFPDNIYFDESSYLPTQLFNVLGAFAHQNNDVGYCQGLNYIAGLLILATKNEEVSFWLLKVLVEEILPQYYIQSMSGLLTDMAVLDDLVSKRYPAVHQHLLNIGMPWAVTTTKWFICIYAEVLPTETVLRIWDCLFSEGSKVIFRVALTLICLHKKEIMACRDLAEVVTCFKEMGNSPNVINCHIFVKCMFDLPNPLSNALITKLRLKHANATSK